MSFTVSSHAKINCYLAVKEKLPSGLHEIETVFLPVIDPRDTLTFSESDKLEVTCSVDSVPEDKDNLCHKAVRGYAETAKFAERIDRIDTMTGWRIHIEKRIPAAAGLGGGSGNAAVVLNFLQSRFQCLSEGELTKLAARLGADIPFFLESVPAIGRGIGDRLTPVPVHPQGVPLLIVNPWFPVRTKWMYDQLTRVESPPLPPSTLKSTLSSLKSGDWPMLGRSVRNDFSKILFDKFPLLQIIREHLDGEGALSVDISGSGPTLFAIGRDLSHVESMGASLRSQFGDTFGIWETTSKSG